MRTALALLFVLLGACGLEIQPALIASDITITQPVSGRAMRAGYLTLTNNSNETITITRVSSPHFESVALHESVIEEGVARMRPLEKIEILANASAVLEPGGKHLMLMRPRDSGDESSGNTGSAESVSLQFYDGSKLLLTVTSSESR